MSSSPFAPYHNALFYLETQGSKLAQDPETGNWIVLGGLRVECKAFLKPSKTKYEKTEGTDPMAAPVTGYLVEPMIMPAYITFPLKLSGQMKSAQGAWQFGEFWLDMVLGSAVGVEAIAGQKLEGTFKIHRQDFMENYEPQIPLIDAEQNQEITNLKNEIETLKQNIGNPTSHTFLYTQSTLSTTWQIIHNLNQEYLDVKVFDQNQNQVLCDLDFVSNNQVNLIFTTPTRGKALLTY